jgi:hypothetical protein
VHLNNAGNALFQPKGAKQIQGHGLVITSVSQAQVQNLGWKTVNTVNNPPASSQVSPQSNPLRDALIGSMDGLFNGILAVTGVGSLIQNVAQTINPSGMDPGDAADQAMQAMLPGWGYDLYTRVKYDPNPLIDTSQIPGWLQELGRTSFMPAVKLINLYAAGSGQGMNSIDNILRGNYGEAILGLNVFAYDTTLRALEEMVDPKVVWLIHQLDPGERAYANLQSLDPDAAARGDAAGPGAAFVGEVIIAAATMGRVRTYQTYTKVNPRTGKVYSGRTSGYGTPRENVRARDRGHFMNKKGYGPAQLDQSSSDRAAIRGREQQLIEQNGGAKSEGGTSGNQNNGISPRNRRRGRYLDHAIKEFGPLPPLP